MPTYVHLMKQCCSGLGTSCLDKHIIIITIYPKALLLVAVAMAALSIEEQWKNFKATYGKTYDNPEEEQKRYQIFQDKVKYIEDYNNKSEAGEKSGKLAINKFGDLTADEVVERYTDGRPDPDRKPPIGK
ncbi:unnamed protein product [Callosobruchus maculatus]|uniref:Cathepsin propeptide inhibitor domain-containing protein n=1 Tax=Callosobruchus maculatus TaxID=64391 RepID=A0A653CA65_CALMS|nr:unnamed protein product [Callosobruchus maculatus]